MSLLVSEVVKPYTSGFVPIVVSLIGSILEIVLISRLTQYLYGFVKVSIGLIF